MIKAIIVDDEAPARREMRRLLEAIPNVVVAGDAQNIATARGLAQRTRPDVVFLDIQLRHESGFALLADLDDTVSVVFVTAYDSFAIRAFDEHALDYLLKPVDPLRLAKSVERLQALMVTRTSSIVSPAPFSARNWTFVQDGDRAEFIRFDGIATITADHGRTVIRMHTGVTIGSARSLDQWLALLPAADFHRVHRGTIVNMAYVERIEPWSNYTYRLHLRNDADPVVMSRRYAARLRDTTS